MRSPIPRGGTCGGSTSPTTWIASSRGATRGRSISTTTRITLARAGAATAHPVVRYADVCDRPWRSLGLDVRGREPRSAHSRAVLGSQRRSRLAARPGCLRRRRPRSRKDPAADLSRWFERRQNVITTPTTLARGLRRSVCFGSAVALTAAAAASAGGRPDVAIGVGASHSSVQVPLSAHVGDMLYAGVRAVPPRGGFVRIFPIFGGIPGVSGQFFPATGILCFEGPRTTCRRLPADARAALKPFGRLPLRRLAPTRAVRLTVGSKRIDLPNLRTAIELAVERGGHPASRPGGGRRLDVSWRGPAAGARPNSFRLRGEMLYARGLRYALSPSAARYLRDNL